MRGVGQADAIESVTFRHEEGNEGEKNRVERGNAGLFGVKLLKRQGGSLPGLCLSSPSFMATSLTSAQAVGLSITETVGEPARTATTLLGSANRSIVAA